MTYSHIDPTTLTLISGPHAAQSTYVKQVTSCGNPEVLLADGPYDLPDSTAIVPCIHANLAEGQRHGEPVVYADRVEVPAVAIPIEELMQQAKQQLTDAVQRHLDTTAQSRGYDGILSLCSYASSPNPPFATEAAAGLAWRDAVWLHCFGVMAAVQAGQRTIPTEAELLAELPEIGR